MKKVILSVAVISAFSFASCKKDRVCTCIDNNGSTMTRTFTQSKGSDAKAACLSYTETNNNVTTTVTCTLK